MPCVPVALQCKRTHAELEKAVAESARINKVLRAGGRGDQHVWGGGEAPSKQVMDSQPGPLFLQALREEIKHLQERKEVVETQTAT